jgi:hypothetical protein
MPNMGRLGYPSLGLENLRNCRRHQNLMKGKPVSAILTSTQAQNARITSGYSLMTTEVKIGYVRFGAFTAVTMKNVVFWDVALCRSCVNRCFGGKSVNARSTQGHIPEDDSLQDWIRLSCAGSGHTQTAFTPKLSSVSVMCGTTKVSNYKAKDKQ